MSRIAPRFAEIAPRPALVGFITAGDPTPAHTVPAMHALVAGGTDVIELGVPFSDPEAEGPSIQRSSERALANGVNLRQVLGWVAEFRTRDAATPVVLMGYLNSFLAMGDFAARAADAGVDGVIIVNLPPEEAGPIKAALAARDLDTIFLVAPTTTPERAEMIVGEASGFVYYVSLKGITGADHLDTASVGERVAMLKTRTRLPVCVGFGIKTPAAATAVAGVADGVVVGSAIVDLMASEPHDPQACARALERFCAELYQGILAR